jgi:hypothetical protein
MVVVTFSALAALLAAALLAGGLAARGGENWPGFRGPTGLGYTDETRLPLTWGGAHDENVLWKAALHGQGHASPIVWADRVFLCTACWPPGTQRPEEVIPEQHVLCYQAGNGKLLWDTRVPPGPWLRTDFRSGPGGGYACPTPVTDGRLVYCLFGSSVIVALDFQGKTVWRREIVPHGRRHQPDPLSRYRVAGLRDGSPRGFAGRGPGQGPRHGEMGEGPDRYGLRAQHADPDRGGPADADALHRFRLAGGWAQRPAKRGSRQRPTPLVVPRQR